MLSFFCLASFGQTTSFSITTIPYVQPDFTYTPGRGANEWSYGQNIVNIPVQGTNTQRNDRYWRFTWLDFQPAGGSSGVFNFATFDSKIQESITKGQKFSFGVMQQCTSCDANLQNPIAGNTNLLPTWLINAMPNSYAFGGDWYPDYNSSAYLNALKALSVAINAHILAGSFNGVQYRNVIDFIDIRGYGNFGEWTNNDFSHITPTVASLDSIISYQGNVFTTFQCVVMIGAFSGGQLSNVNVPPAVGYYALTTKNSFGVFGWRRDNWGQTDNYIRMFLDLNPTVFNGLSFKDTIMTRHQFAPVCGEPQDCGSAGNFPDLPIEIVRYGGSSFGNGNFNCAVNATIQNNFRAASLVAGYRILPTSGNISNSLVTNGAFTITTSWQNVGVAPTYENWNTQYELRTGTTVVWTGTSSKIMRLFQPGATVATIDNFTLTGVAPGLYGLYVIVRDPLGFRQPLPLAITGRNSDGSYLLVGGLTVSGAGGPTANAGSNQNITVNSVNLSAAASVGATTYAWTRISGPNVPSITTPTTVTTSVTGLVTGTYVFQVAINGGSSGPLISQVTVVVNLSLPVVANAGPNQNITLPTSTVTLNGSASTGTISSYAWTRISGPNTPSITTPTTVSTTVTGLIQGTYIFQLSLNAGAATSQVTVNVIAAAPSANAGPNQNISTTSTTLNGTASVGAISYLWSIVSGPNTPPINSPATATTTVSGMITGTYVFRLSINGGVSTSNVTITVNLPPVPIANAGPNQAITLPANSVTLNGSASSGTITSYSWTRISGPNSPTIATPATVTTAINGMIAGTYLFQLSINGGISTSQVQITVNPAPLPATNIFTTQNPPVTSLNDGVALELGVKFQSSIPGFITGIRFWKGSTPTNTGTHIGELYDAAGTRLAQATFTGETASGWQTVTFSSAVPILANTTYIAAYWSGNGFYTVTNNYFTVAVVNGTLTALASTGPNPNGVFRYTATPAFPTSTFQSSNYWVDVVFSSTSPQPPFYRKGRKGLPKLLITLP